MNIVRAAQTATTTKTSEPVSEIVPIRDGAAGLRRDDERVVRADDREIENDLYDNVACTD